MHRDWPKKSETAVARRGPIIHAATAGFFVGHDHHFLVGTAFHAEEHESRIDNLELGVLPHRHNREGLSIPMHLLLRSGILAELYYQW